jgi:hypothetical protein
LGEVGCDWHGINITRFVDESRGPTATDLEPQWAQSAQGTA